MMFVVYVVDRLDGCVIEETFEHMNDARDWAAEMAPKFDLDAEFVLDIIQ